MSTTKSAEVVRRCLQKIVVLHETSTYLCHAGDVSEYIRTGIGVNKIKEWFHFGAFKGLKGVCLGLQEQL